MIFGRPCVAIGDVHGVIPQVARHVVMIPIIIGYDSYLSTIVVTMHFDVAT